MKPTNRTLAALALKPGLAVAAIALLAAISPGEAAGGNPNPRILPVHSKAHGKTLGEWSAEWWKLGIETPPPGPFSVGGCFELSKSVWGIAAPLGMSTVSCTIPPGKALFIGGISIECSSLEPPESGFHGDTETEQAECATFWADHIIGMAVEIDGVSVNDMPSYRVLSPQFAFTAPDPNFLGVPGGGAGTAVADGFYLLSAPLSKGEHTIRVSGRLRSSVAEGDPLDLDITSDVTFQITVSQ